MSRARDEFYSRTWVFLSPLLVADVVSLILEIALVMCVNCLIQCSNLVVCD